MVVYMVQMVKFDADKGEIWGYIYPEIELIPIFSSYTKAHNWVYMMLTVSYGIAEEYIYIEPDDKDSTMFFVMEDKNERTPKEEVMWAVIVKRELDKASGPIGFVRRTQNESLHSNTCRI